jgi:amino acid transporter
MIAAVVLCIITLFNGFRYFIHDSSYVKGKYITNAVLSYVGIVIFVGMIVGYKLIMQEARVSPDEADLYGGKAKIDQEEDDFLAEQSAKNGGFGEGKWERIYRLTVGNFF